jgi:hypothetical protein
MAHRAAAVTGTVTPTVPQVCQCHEKCQCDIGPGASTNLNIMIIMMIADSAGGRRSLMFRTAGSHDSEQSPRRQAAQLESESFAIHPRPGPGALTQAASASEAAALRVTSPLRFTVARPGPGPKLSETRAGHTECQIRMRSGFFRGRGGEAAPGPGRRRPTGAATMTRTFESVTGWFQVHYAQLSLVVTHRDCRRGHGPGPGSRSASGAAAAARPSLWHRDCHWHWQAGPGPGRRRVARVQRRHLLPSRSQARHRSLSLSLSLSGSLSLGRERERERERERKEGGTTQA